jgi:hypothetical protein
MILFLLLIPLITFSQDQCVYTYTVWNTQTRKADGPFKVQKKYAELEAYEKGPLGCTPCEIDQREIMIKNGLKVKVCKNISAQLEKNLNEILKSGFPITSLTGYRTSISKGKADSQGRRTEFSHHAFGVAIDINEEKNGLYDHCLSWGPSCRLIKGGSYNPGSAGSISPSSPVIKIMNSMKFQWGGSIQGLQKDFMHFSSDGY